MTYTSAVESSGQFLNEASISSGSTSSISSAVRAEAAKRSSASSATAIDTIASDSANVSLAGAMLSQASTGSDVRFDKVAALQRSIGNGTYVVTSANVAGKLFDSLQP